MKILPTRTHLARITAVTLIVCAIGFTISALLAGPSATATATATATPGNQWPALADRPKVKQGFTNALTRSAKDKSYRDDLLKFADQKTVKTRVREELNKVPGAETMDIPDEIVLIFYVPQAAGKDKRPLSDNIKNFLGNDENRNYHVFYLPTYNEQDTLTHPYDVHIKCCYFPW